MDKAKIINLETNEEIECLFNPNEYTFQKSNTWTKTTAKGENVPTLEFGGGSSATLSMQLFLDTSTTGKDIRKVSEKVRKLMDVNPSLKDMNSGKGRPPMVDFHWGRIWTFKAVITSITEKFTLFRDDGVPVRATLDVTFLQAKDAAVFPAQNPTTPGTSGYKQWTVRDGDSIDWIAFSEYGDSSMWRYIADVNGLDNPRRLRPGQKLAIAPPP